MPTFSRSRRPWLAAVLAGAVLAAGGCSQQADSAPAAKTKRSKVHLVELATVERKALELSRVYTGSLRARRIVRIHAQEEGRVTELPFFESDSVDEGQVVLRLDRTLLESELAKASAVRKEADANLERLARLARTRLVAEDELLRGRTAVEVARAEESVLRTRLGYTVVGAPFAGVVTERLLEPGDIVARHGHVLTLADPSSLVAVLDVSELLLPHLATGSQVSVRIDALGDRVFAGQVSRIHPTLDAETRQGRVEVRLTHPPEGARAGQFARVRFEVRALARQVIPFSALRRDRDGEHVFRLTGSGEVERVAVRGGRRLADRVEVLEGLSDGDRVVTKGFLGLAPGKKVKPVGARDT
jgi:RND family efflux transporter MFP subunit